MGQEARRKKKEREQNELHSGSGQRKIILILGIIIVLGGAIVLLVQYNDGLSSNFSPEQTAKEKAREYDAYAGQLLEPIIIEMAAPVSPYKFKLNSIEEVETLLWKGLDLDTTLTTAWEKLGYITSRFHGKQAMLRYESYAKQEKQEEAAQAEQEAVIYFAQADVYYDKALEFGHAEPDEIYYQKAEAATLRYDYGKAIELIILAIREDPRERKYRARVAEYNLYAGRFAQAVERLDQYKTLYPDSEFAYRNLGSYYLYRGDTAKAVGYYAEAIERGTKPEVGKYLTRYFKEKGDMESAEYYRQKAIEAEINWNPDQY
jgi:Flp pilus assembly protein TadD